MSAPVDKTGQRFGTLTLTRKVPGGYECVCDCGRTEFWPGVYFKPCEKTVKKCHECRKLICEVCGDFFWPKRGHQASRTCSEFCHSERRRIRGRSYYRQVKDTPEWREKYAAYNQKIRQERESDPEFAEFLRAGDRERNRRYREKLRSTPEMRAKALQMIRDKAKARRDREIADPALRQRRIDAARERWQNMSQEDRLEFAGRRHERAGARDLQELQRVLAEKLKDKT